MALADCQIQVRDLVMGPGTPYTVLGDFNPFNRSVRANQTQPRAWNHGSWSGAEWQDQAAVPIRVRTQDPDDRTRAGWLAAHQQLAAAFAPVGDAVEDVELRFAVGSTEYVMFGRPRMVEPNANQTRRGHSFTSLAFVATDPLIYSGDLLSTGTISLPIQAGGLLVPFTVPFLSGGTLLGGSADLTNDGTAPSPITFRIDGPVQQPFVAVQSPGAVVNTLRFDLTIPTGQWLIVNTGARTAFLNGLPQASRRGQVSAEDDWPLLQPGVNTIRFGAAEHNDQAALTVEARSAWW